MLSDLMALFQSEWNAIKSAPLLFVAAVVVVCGGLWKVMNWHFNGRLESLEGRLRLKDDTIAHLEKNANIQTSDAPQRQDWTEMLASDTSPDRRVFVAAEVTVDYLTGLYDGRTQVQGDRLADPYIGKWMEISGSIEIMTGLGAKATTITLSPYTVGHRGISVWMMFLTDRDRLETIPLGGELTALGRIEKVTQDEIKLLECQLL
jgi:hypothetical protein